MYIWKQFFQNFRRKRGLYETRLYYSFYRTFLCSGISFPGSSATGICSVLPDNASLFLSLTYRRIYLLARRSLKNAQEEAKFQALQKQEQLQKEQEQLFVSRKQETLAFQQATIRKLQTLQNYLKTNEYDKIQDYLPAITDDFQRERFHPICQDSLINAILADKRFLAMQKNIKVTYEVLLPEKSNIPSSELSSIFFNLLDNGIESCNASGSEAPFISVTSKMSAGFLTVHAKQQRSGTTIQQQNIKKRYPQPWIRPVHN